MGREDGDISYDETDFTGIKVLILEWTHGGSEYLNGVDIPVFWRARLRRQRHAALREDVTKTPQALSYAAW